MKRIPKTSIKTAARAKKRLPEPSRLTLKDLLRELSRAGNAKKASGMQAYFKTGKGEYAEGDIFLGISVPAQRKIASRYGHLDFADLEKLIKSKIHEHRFTCTEILNLKYERASGNVKKGELSERAEQERLVKWYLAHTKQMNNWDLVDNTAHQILGNFLFEKGNTALLYRLAKSKVIWERRIAIVSTFAFIRRAENAEDFYDTLKVCEILLSDTHDLIHKACGWMLREMGKKNMPLLVAFLEAHGSYMPRTMLRYSIERMSKVQQKHFLGL